MCLLQHTQGNAVPCDCAHLRHLLVCNSNGSLSVSSNATALDVQKPTKLLKHLAYFGVSLADIVSAVIYGIKAANCMADALLQMYTAHSCRFT